MYQVTLTNTQYPAHERIIISIWELLPDGSKRPVMHEVCIVPSLAGGLFETSPETATQSLIRWLRATHPEFLDTDQ